MIGALFLFFIPLFIIMNTAMALKIVLDTVQNADTEIEEDRAERLSAASANMGFYSVFILDYNFNSPKYTSYMSAHTMAVPDELQSYLSHLQDLPNTADLEQDVADYFPFTQFQTFITAFPWYNTMLSAASMSTLYLPEYFDSLASSTTERVTYSPEMQPTGFESSNDKISQDLTSANTGSKSTQSNSNSSSQPSVVSADIAILNQSSLFSTLLLFIIFIL